MRTPEVSLILRLKDMLSGPLQRATKDMAKQTERAAADTARSITRSTSDQQRAYARLAQAREQLGVRSEQAIRREIQQTEAAYNRLARSGMVSANDQSRAWLAMTNRVRELRREIGLLDRAQKAANFGRGGMAIAAGGWAATQVLKSPIERTMSYDRRLAHMANTAYADRDVAGRRKGMDTLKLAVNHAVRFGGGTHEQAAEALDEMIASNAVTADEAIKMLPGIMKAASGSGANAVELATIAYRAKQNFKISPDDFPVVLSAAMRAGQAGGFELKNMAKWLPEQMAMAGSLGISGKEGFAKLVAWNQASVITSGTKDAAGNNLRDLLNELKTPHFRNFIASEYLGRGQKARKGEKNNRLEKIDRLFLDYQSRGVDKVEATIDMMQTIFSKDKKYQELQTRLKALPKDDTSGRGEILEAMTAQVVGTKIGKVFHNQQGLMAFLGQMNNREYVKDVIDSVKAEYSMPENKSSVGLGFELITTTPSYQVERSANEKVIGEQKLFEPINNAIGDAAGKLADYAQKYPALSVSVVGATAAMNVLSAAVAGSALMRLLTAGGAASVVTGSSAAGARTAAQFSPVVARAAAPALAFSSLASFTTNEEDDEVLNGKERWRKLNEQYSPETIKAARKKYQPWYQLGDGYAVENERWIQQYLSQNQAQQPAQPIVNNIYLDGKKIAEHTSASMNREAKRY